MVYGVWFRLRDAARARELFPAAVSLTIEIVRIDINAGGKIVLHQINRRFRFDADFVPAWTTGRMLRRFAHPAHCAAAGHPKDAREQKSQGPSRHHSILSVRLDQVSC